MKQIVLLIAAVSLTGCAETVYRTKLEVYCPPIQTYTQEFNNELADELDALEGTTGNIHMAIADYARLRDRIRACKKEKGNI